jgi:hypothetical protein
VIGSSTRLWLQVNTAASLAVWFVASVALVLVVTLVYVFVLNKSPPPPTLTVEKIEQYQSAQVSIEPEVLLSKAREALGRGDISGSIELAVDAAGVILSSLLGRSGNAHSNLGLSDMAYIVQTKARSSPDISQPVYQLNLLRLEALRGENVTPEQADWAINTATWLAQIAQSDQIAF